MAALPVRVEPACIAAEDDRTPHNHKMLVGPCDVRRVRAEVQGKVSEDMIHVGLRIFAATLGMPGTSRTGGEEAKISVNLVALLLARIRDSLEEGRELSVEDFCPWIQERMHLLRPLLALVRTEKERGDVLRKVAQSLGLGTSQLDPPLPDDAFAAVLSAVVSRLRMALQMPAMEEPARTRTTNEPRVRIVTKYFRR